MKTIWALISLLPEFFRLIQEIEKSIQEAETKRKIKDDVQKIREAFKNKDASGLRHVFSTDELPDK